MADAQQLLGAGNIKTDESTSDPGNFFKGPIHGIFFCENEKTTSWNSKELSLSIIFF